MARNRQSRPRSPPRVASSDVWQERLSVVTGRLARRARLAGETAPNGLRFFGSPDGITWIGVSRRPPLGPCGFSGFVGAGDRLLLIGGDEGCGSGIWVSHAPRT